MSSPDPSENEHLQRLIEKRQKGREIGLVYREYLYHSVSGLEVGVGVAMGAILGHFADGHFGTDPWLTLIGLVLGMIHGGRVMYKLAKRNSGSNAEPEHTKSQVAPQSTETKETLERGDH
jgi:hypothetical protein